MFLSKSVKPFSLRTTFVALFALQLTILVGTIISVRTSVLWVFSLFSFVPAVTVCLLVTEKKYVLPSLLVFFISQLSIFIFSHPTWGFSFGSDSINDFHVALLMSERNHFDLGRLGYASRLSYSYYPMLHLFSVTLSKVSGVSLVPVALYFIPILGGIMTTFALYYLNHDLAGLEGRERNLATLFFGLGFYYTSFHSQFVRETFAFPLVLLSLWLATRIALSRRALAFVPMLYVFFVAVVLSHHISSFLLLVILAILTLSFNVFYGNNRLNTSVFFSAVILGTYTVFVVWDFSITQLVYFYEGFQVLFRTEGGPSLMAPYEPWRRNLALTYYVLTAVFMLAGGIKLLRKKSKDWIVITIISFFGISFFLSILLRLSTSADPWGWTYYTSLRGTIWAFIGISILLALGFTYTLKLDNKVTSGGLFALLLIVCVLAAGKFSQYPLLISDPSIDPAVSYSRYTAALWLREEAIHGSNILVAPHDVDYEAFERSRNMAPYAYLKEYFLDEEKGRTYDNFGGYVPLVGGFFDQYIDLPNVQIIYSNGDAQLGYAER